MPCPINRYSNLTLFPGILLAKTKKDKLMNTPIIKNRIGTYVDENYWMKRLNTQLKETTNEKLTEFPSSTALCPLSLWKKKLVLFH